MNKEQVLEKLKLINYPGFNRDIVSFGMIKNITILKSNIKLELNISSQNEDKKQQVWLHMMENISMLSVVWV